MTTTERELERRALAELRNQVASAAGLADPVAELLEAAVDHPDPELRAAAIAAGRRRLGIEPCEHCRRAPPMLVTSPEHAATLVADPSFGLALAAFEKFRNAGAFDLEAHRVVLERDEAGRWHFHHNEGIRWNGHRLLDWLRLEV